MSEAKGDVGLIKSVAFVGGGNMAEAIARGLLASGLRPDQLRASDPLESRRSWLACSTSGTPRC